MDGQEKAVARCAECGAALAGEQARCWLCERKLSDGESENPYASPRPVAGEYAAAQFSLASLFLVMTLVAVGLGLFVLAPGLGVLFAFVGVPALIRTMTAASQQRQKKAPLSPLEKICTFLISWFLMGVIGLAAFVAFAAVCVAGAVVTSIATPNMEAVFIMGALAGLAAALPLTVWLLRLTRPSNMEYSKSSLRQ